MPLCQAPLEGGAQAGTAKHRLTGTACRSPPPGRGGWARADGAAQSPPPASGTWGARRPAQPADACLQQPQPYFLPRIDRPWLALTARTLPDGTGTAAAWLATKPVRSWAPLLLPPHHKLTTTTLWFAAASEIIPIDLRSNLAILIYLSGIVYSVRHSLIATSILIAIRDLSRILRRSVILSSATTATQRRRIPIWPSGQL
jgi:hypothetical protein